MSKLSLNVADLAITSFEPATTASAVAGGTIQSGGEDTLDQVCFCMTWVKEDCFGPTAGCSTSDAA
ncbi:MAG TPA: hypothetical protein VFE05_01265 [Longimicrobiaceae bacterium]|jgi:hypothetical protein|nr:hypothetical protein [Longimicrobiaceae bacterium]